MNAVSPSSPEVACGINSQKPIVPTSLVILLPFLILVVLIPIQLIQVFDIVLKSLLLNHVVIGNLNIKQILVLLLVVDVIVSSHEFAKRKSFLHGTLGVVVLHVVEIGQNVLLDLLVTPDQQILRDELSLEHLVVFGALLQQLLVLLHQSVGLIVLRLLELVEVSLVALGLSSMQVVLSDCHRTDERTQVFHLINVHLVLLRIY